MLVAAKVKITETEMKKLTCLWLPKLKLLRQHEEANMLVAAKAKITETAMKKLTCLWLPRSNQAEPENAQKWHTGLDRGQF